MEFGRASNSGIISVSSDFVSSLMEANLPVLLGPENNLNFIQIHLTSDIHLTCPGIRVCRKGK